MTSRPHSVTFAVGITVVVVVTLLFLLHKTHSHLQDVQAKLFQTQTHYSTISRQFDSLFEYKERLEKSFVTLKNERASLFEIDDVARDELTLLKSNFAKQIQVLQAELAACRSSSNSNHHDELAPASAGGWGEGDLNSKSKTAGKVRTGTGNGLSSPSVPLLAPLSLARERDAGTGIGNTETVSVNFKRKPPLVNVDVNSHGSKVEASKDGKEKENKEAIQSPIGQVAVHPGQPSGDPNEDTAGNVLI